MVAGSPCRDEHVIYEIARDEKSAGEKIDAYKVVGEQKEFMGTLQCRYNADKNNLSCSGGNPQKKGDWEFVVSGDTMRGTLVIGEERTLYRRVSVKRKGGKT
jgi:predicted RNA-binding protein